MKKTLLVALVSVWISMGAFATTSVVWLPPNPNSIGYDSVRIPYNLVATSFVGNHKERLLLKKNGTNTWFPADSLVSNSLGVKNMGARNLLSATNYFYAVEISQHDTLPKDTAFCTLYTITTKAGPVKPSISVQVIPKIGTSELIVTSTITNGTNYSYQIYSIYGDLYEFTSDTMSASGTKKDTLHLLTPNAQTQTLYCLWFHSSVTGDTLMNCSSFTTPGLVGDSVTASVISTGTDSATIRANVIRDGDGSSSLTFIVKDSTGTTTVGSFTTAVNGTGNYSRTQYGLLDNKLYRFYVISRDTLGNDTITGSFRAKQRIPKPAPVASFIYAPAPVTYCGHIDIAGYKIIPSDGDVGRAVIVRKVNDSTLSGSWDTIQVFATVTSTISAGITSFDAPQTGVRYYWRIITWSADGLSAVSAAINAPTASYNPPSFLIDQVGFATSTPTVDISGNAFCESAVVYITITNTTTGQVWYDTVDVGHNSFDTSIVFPNLPPGNYTVRGNLRMAGGSSIIKETPPITRTVVSTGVKQNTLQNVSVFPNPSNGFFSITGIDEGTFRVFNSLGQQITGGNIFHENSLQGNPPGMYILQITNKKGETAVKQLILQ